MKKLKWWCWFLYDECCGWWQSLVVFDWWLWSGSRLNCHASFTYIDPSCRVKRKWGDYASINKDTSVVGVSLTSPRIAQFSLGRKSLLCTVAIFLPIIIIRASESRVCTITKVGNVKRACANFTKADWTRYFAHSPPVNVHEGERTFHNNIICIMRVAKRQDLMISLPPFWSMLDQEQLGISFNFWIY